jgi:hypothetical protein
LSAKVASAGVVAHSRPKNCTGMPVTASFWSMRMPTQSPAPSAASVGRAACILSRTCIPVTPRVSLMKRVTPREPILRAMAETR